MIEGHRQGRYDAQGNVQKGVVGWCGCVFFCLVGVVVFSAVAHGGLCGRCRCALVASTSVLS